VVTKKDSGDVVGHTTPGKLGDYLAALHIHAPEGHSEGGMVLDGLKDLNPSIIEAAFRKASEEIA
jgi:hypothetical protein